MGGVLEFRLGLSKLGLIHIMLSCVVRELLSYLMNIVRGSKT